MISRRDLLRGASTLGAVSLVGLPIGCSSEEDDAPTGSPYFKHGVASGDPLPDAVVIWTRVTRTADAPAQLEVTWEVSTTLDFAQTVASGTFATSADRDDTVKVDVKGLSAGTTYYYRFHALGGTSPVGRTRTAPSGATARLRFGVVSCASLAHGYFHAYRQLAGRLDLDAILHLGDYIYEYGSGEYGDVREYEPPHEIVSLADYRTRYAQYRRDPDLRAVHQQFPFITIWDDHETTNDSWRDGAEDHHPPTEGPWADRKAAAQKAYSEWMPIRDGEDPGKIYRSFQFGDLVDLFMLDTRIVGRDLQADGKKDPTLNDDARQLLGEEQEKWFFDGLRASKAKWRFVGQQVMVSQFPQFFNSDAWDGYPKARARLLEAFREVKDVVVLTGDIHMSWACDLTDDPTSTAYDPATGVGSAAVEFVAPGVTSPGLPENVSGLASGWMSENRHNKFVDVYRRGYIVLDVTSERTQASFYHYTEVDQRQATPTFTAAFAVYAGAPAVKTEAAEAGAPTNVPAGAPAEPA